MKRFLGGLSGRVFFAAAICAGINGGTTAAGGAGGTGGNAIIELDGPPGNDPSTGIATGGSGGGTDGRRGRVG